MKPSIQNVRELAGKNAVLLARTNATRKNILYAAQAECMRLTTLIDGVSHADALINDAKAAIYQNWIAQRASLLQFLADTGDE